VTYFDTAASYGDGRSERAIGEVAKDNRARMVIASKTAERTYDGAMRELEASLKRLQTDHLDVWLMHHVSLSDGTQTLRMGQQGAIKSVRESSSLRKDRAFFGCERSSSHRRSGRVVAPLQFDVVLTVVNAIDRHHPDSFISGCCPWHRRKTRVVAMKIPAYGRLLRPEEGVGIRQAFAYALSQPESPAASLPATPSKCWKKTSLPHALLPRLMRERKRHSKLKPHLTGNRHRFTEAGRNAICPEKRC
jgi:predicted aldo/keto reductase-like oxidoreductase